jgi:uracil-DNA glycosylase
MSRCHESGAFDRLLGEARACRHCDGELPLGPRPVLRGRPSARLMIISQAPGTHAHRSGLSFDDASGNRLRRWLALDRGSFYDETRIAIVPIGFGYPGRAARGGDLPPRPECAPLWHARLHPYFTAVKLSLLVGGYAIRHYLPASPGCSLSEILARWRDFLPKYFLLPHPSWRTTAWERRHPWFVTELVPELRARVAAALKAG